VGVAYSQFSGQNSYNYDPIEDYDLSGSMFGGFAGYNRSVSSLVLGAELAISTGDVFEEDFEDRYEYNTFIDLKARAGYDAGRFMPYGLFGLSYGNFTVDSLDPVSASSALRREFEKFESGILIGAGVDFAVNEQFRVGAELVSRRVDITPPSVANLRDVDGTVNSISVRASYNF
jgi:opacity protein-like surface antigen